MVYTNTGISEIVDWLSGSSATAPTHIGIGTGSTFALKTDTTLSSEVIRNAINSTLTGTNWVSFTIILDSTQQNAVDLYEFGLFNATTDGDMSQRVTHTIISKNSQIELEYEVRIRLQN